MVHLQLDARLLQRLGDFMEYLGFRRSGWERE